MVSFTVPTVTCSASPAARSYALFQYLEGASSLETGYVAVLYLDCGSGTFSAGMRTNVYTGNPSSGGCAEVPVAPGDSISFSERDVIPVHNNGEMPLGARRGSSDNGMENRASAMA